MTDILNLAKTALEATAIGKGHVYEGFPETFAVYPCAAVLERVTFGANDVHELTVNAWTKDDSQVVKDLLRTLTLTGYTTTVISISDGIPGPDGAGIYVFPVTAQYRVTLAGSGAGTTIVYPSLRPLEQEVEDALHATDGLHIWRIDVDGATIISPTALYSVIEDVHEWWTDYMVNVNLIVDGEPSSAMIASIIASIESLVHARQLSYALDKDKETGYHIARMVFKIQRAIGE
ncbi:MAG TPA: hypothetical protein PKH46_06725, partial [Candidatus Cryosericum sp.]|nr:hypothetical protein [Candidatus Cryosericum sp.]